MKEWLARLFGAPTLERLAGDTVRALRARGLSDIRVDLERAEIHATRDGGAVVLNLGNLFAGWRRVPRRERAAVLARFLASLDQAGRSPGKDTPWAEARTQLLPVLRSASTLGLSALARVDRRDGGPLRTWAVWADGVDTLLPATDFVALAWRSGEADRHVLVPWADALRLAGALMQPSGHAPPPWRVRAFPDAALLAELERHADGPVLSDPSSSKARG